MQVTMLCLVAAGILLALGFVGVPGSLALVALLLVLSVGLYLTRPTTDVGRRLGVDADSLLAALWLAPALAALPLAVEPGASTAEVQALGGLLGLVGMANYFLRPVYLLGYSAVEMVLQTAGGSADR